MHPLNPCSRPARRTGAALFTAVLGLSTLAHGQTTAPPARGNAGQELTGGEVRWVPIPARDDAAPLPIGPRWQEGAEGDVLLGPGGGDPFHLGFAAGVYTPPAGERIDPALVAALAAVPDDGRPRRESYAFVMFERRITAERVAALEGLGARVLGLHPHNCVRVALIEGALTPLAQLDFVRWVGLARPWQKVHPELTRVLGDTRDADLVDVIVSVFESDLNEASLKTPFGTSQPMSPEGAEELPADQREAFGRWRTNGWQERALRELGMDVTLYSARSDSFHGRVPRAQLERLVALDFVQFVEPKIAPTRAHDESMPLIHADLTRVSWDGGTNAAAVIGEADSGIDNTHTGLNHIWGWGWDLASTSGGAWTDGDEHGSHVAGTIFGKADVDRSLDGVAPGLGSARDLRVFNVKIFNDFGNWGGAAMSDILDRFENPVTDANGNITPRPHAINHSWGTRGSLWYGTEADCRELDLSIWASGQLHIFAAGNEGSGGSTLRQQATAKNVFTVGSVLDHHDPSVGYPGTVWTSSSRGPAGDLRWKPNVVAPGRLIDSVDANSSTGYVNKSGTSMATPHVTGLAAQLVDHYSFLRHRPAVLGATLMATALTKDGVLLSAPSTASTGHHNTYGAGRVEAFKAHNMNSQALSFWQFDMNGNSAHAELDFTVAAGATQLSIVMLYHELAASSGASVAIVNDLDMYIDRAPFSGSGNTGDYSAHQSTRDNAETRILANPGTGDWKVKVFPEDLPYSLVNTVRVGVAVVVTYGDTTPDATLTTTIADRYVQPNDIVELTSTVASPSYVTSAVHLENSLSGTLLSASTTLEDGRVSDLMNNPNQGAQVTLGNIRGGHDRSVVWTGRWATEGIKFWSVSMDTENGGTANTFTTVYVDATGPSAPSLLGTNHPNNTHSCDTNLQVNWTAATDAVSGVDGYRIIVGHSPNPLFSSTPNLGVVTSYSTTLAPSADPYYVHLRAIDRSGNWGAIIGTGPFWIVAAGSSNYCTGAINSTGVGGSISRVGSLSLANNNFSLRASNLPNTGFGLFIMAANAGQSVLGDGFLCLSGTITRLGVGPISGGVANYAVNFTTAPVSNLIDGGETWRFQTWYRDAGGAGYNLTNGIAVTFCD